MGIQEIYYAAQQQKARTTKNLTSPQIEAVHSTKPIKDEISSSKYNLF